MALSWIEAQTKVLAAGSGTPFELMEADIRGVKMDVFKNCPPNLALVLQNARNFGDATFIIYEGEKWTFEKTMDQVDGLSHLLVNTYGVKKGDRVAVAMRNFPEWIMAFAAIISVGAVNVSFLVAAILAQIAWVLLFAKVRQVLLNLKSCLVQRKSDQQDNRGRHTQ